jgi:excisionase family DNA binding protein
MRPKELRIQDPATHPRSSVCLRVAAEFLELDERTVKARIESGDLPAWVDGKVYRIGLADIRAYEQRRQHENMRPRRREVSRTTSAST